MNVLIEKQRKVLSGERPRRWQGGFTLVELIVVLVIIGILAAIAYVAYAALIKDSATKAAQATAESVNREAIALAAFDGVAPSERVNDVLDDPGNGFQSVSNTATFGVVPAHLTHAFTLLAVQPASLPTDGDTWEKGDITITYRTGGTYLFANTDSGANNVIYEPSTVPGTATGVICATTDDTTCADGQTLASGGAGGDEGEGGEPAAATVPAAPTGLTATAGDGQVEIAFTAGSDGGDAITNYEYTLNSGMDWFAFDPAVNTSPVTIDGLTNDTTYAGIQLRAVNGIGAGTASATISATPTAGAPAAGVDGVNWTLQSTPDDETRTFLSVAIGNGTFVAITLDGQVMTSTNGSEWNLSTPFGGWGWSDVAYGDGKFVVVGWSGTHRVMTSPDGVTWTPHIAAVDSGWKSVTYGDGKFVAVAQTGDGQRVMTSSDGETWTAQNAAEQNQWWSITYGNGLFVAVAYGYNGNRLMTSPDGVTWSSVTPPGNSAWRGITFGDGLFVAVAYAAINDSPRVMTSSDGVTWAGQAGLESTFGWNSITYGGGLFVAVGDSGSYPVMTSPDGINWSFPTVPSQTLGDPLPPMPECDPLDPFYDPFFAEIGMCEPIYDPIDGWQAVTYGDGMLVAVASTGRGEQVMTSP